MTYVPVSSGAEIAAAIARAVKASGVLVRMEREAFLLMLDRREAPLVVHAEGGFLKTKHSYLTSYKGLALYTKGHEEPLPLPKMAEIVEADKISVPEL